MVGKKLQHDEMQYKQEIGETQKLKARKKKMPSVWISLLNTIP